MNTNEEQELQKISDFLNEASYEGNIGMVELFKFHHKAKPEEKKQLQKHIQNKNKKEAWDLVHKVTGTVLHKYAIGESNKISSDVLDISGAGQDGTDTLANNYKNSTPGQSEKPKKKFKDFRS